jgi:hypothetical protein
MHNFPDEAVPWVGAAATAPPVEDVWGACAPNAIRPAHFKQDKAGAARNAPTLAANLLKYGSHAALTACLFGAAWLAWSYLDRPARTVIRPSVQTAEMGRGPPKIAEESDAEKAKVEALPAAQSLRTEDAANLGGTKPRLNTEISAGIAEVSGMVEDSRPKSPEKLSKASERVDPIGHEIAAFLAAAPAADRSTSAAVTRKRAKGGRGNAFDPSKNPTAPGAPRSLGAIAPATTTNSSASEIAKGQRTN